MDISGIIFAVLVAACLVYLVPRQLNWRIPTRQEIEQQTPLHLSMKTVHAGVPLVQTDTSAEVSTLLMRRAGRRTALRLARAAERMRRGVFVALLLIALATVPFAVVGWLIRWWVPLVGFGVVLAWAVFARLEARRAQRQLDAIVADTELGDNEATIAVHLHDKHETVPADPATIVGPNGDVQLSLWEPITVPPANYLSGPTARTVRTIDLAAPVSPVPVIDDGFRDAGRAIAV